MIVVADNGPIAFLIQIERQELLGRLYAEVAIPPAVALELHHPHTPLSVREWIASPPAWVKWRAPIHPIPSRQRGKGENEAILVALETAGLLLCDDRAAVIRARRLGIVTTGTLGILLTARGRRWLEIDDALGDLKSRTRFHFPEGSVLAKIATQANELRRAIDGEAER